MGLTLFKHFPYLIMLSLCVLIMFVIPVRPKIIGTSIIIAVVFPHAITIMLKHDSSDVIKLKFDSDGLQITNQYRLIGHIIVSVHPYSLIMIT